MKLKSEFPFQKLAEMAHQNTDVESLYIIHLYLLILYPDLDTRMSKERIYVEY